MSTRTANPKVLHIGRTLGWYAVWGPLIGGAPYVWTVIATPFAYLLGIGPALICGALTIVWMRSARLPGPWHSAAFGALFGAVACLLAAWVMQTHGGGGLGMSISTFWLHGLQIDDFTLFLLPHGMFAGAVLAARLSYKAAQPKERTVPSTFVNDRATAQVPNENIAGAIA